MTNSASKNRQYYDIPGVPEKARPFFVKAQENNDTLVIAVHGFTSSPYYIRYLADYLADHGFDVEVVLLAGHGRNIYDLVKTSTTDWYQSLEKVYLKNKNKYKNIFVVGYSFGANLALHLSIQYPQIRGIVAMAMPIFLRDEAKIRFLLPLARIFLKKYKKKWADYHDVQSVEEQGRHVYVPLKSFSQFIKFIDTTTKSEIKFVSTPVLIMHSRDDLISDPKSSEYLFYRLKVKDKHLFILDKHKHNLLQDTRRDFVFTRVVSFIKQRK